MISVCPWGPHPSPSPHAGVELEAQVWLDHTLATLYSFLFLFRKLVSQPLKHFVSTLHLIAFG